MKFNEKLRAHIVSEWKKHYIDYELLKTLIYKGRPYAAKKEVGDETQRLSFSSRVLSNIRSVSESYNHKIKTKYKEKYLKINNYNSIDNSDELFNSKNHNIQDLKENLLEEEPKIFSLSPNYNNLNRLSSLTDIPEEEYYYDEFAIPFIPDNLDDDPFFIELRKELKRVNIFFIKKFDDLKKQADFQYELLLQKDDNKDKDKEKEKDNNNNNNNNNNKISENKNDIEDNNNDNENEKELKKKLKKYRNKESIKRALKELYQLLLKLQSFKVLNYTACVKILKKHDKVYPENKQKKIYLDEIKKLEFCKEDPLNNLLELVVDIYSKKFCDGDTDWAKGQLIMTKRESTDWDKFLLGMKVGMAFILFLWFLWDCVIDENNGVNLFNLPSIYVYTAFGNMVLFQWFWGISVYIWNKHRINYLYIFEFDPKLSHPPFEIFKNASGFTIFFLSNIILYYKGLRDQSRYFDCIPVWIFPWTLVIYFWIRAIFPWQRRKLIWFTIFKVITAPFHKVSFFQSYVGDIFTSFVKVFGPLAYSYCYFFSGDFTKEDNDNDDLTINHFKDCGDGHFTGDVMIPLLSILPLWFRHAQCLRRYHDTHLRIPNIPNAFKYLIALSVVLFGVFHPEFGGNSTSADIYRIVWIFFFCLATLYQYFWDVVMDWGLGRPNGKHFRLRKTILYGNANYYYTAIILDFFLRFFWTLSIIPQNGSQPFGATLQDKLAPFMAGAELFRRSMWGIFRLENEHLNNIEHYRRVDFVPIHFEPETNADDDDENKVRKVTLKIVFEILTILSIVVIISLIAYLSK